MPCLFCGSAGKLSKEHVAPRWIKKLFVDLTDVDYERAFQDAGGAGATHVRPGAPFDQTVKDFCEHCNTGWMAALERELEPMLTPLIQDEPTSIDAIAQERIAVWATKTVLAFGPTNLGRVSVVSPQLYRWFGQWQAPLPGSLVWLRGTRVQASGRSRFIITECSLREATSPCRPARAPPTDSIPYSRWGGSSCVYSSLMYPRVPWRAGVQATDAF